MTPAPALHSPASSPAPSPRPTASVTEKAGAFVAPDGKALYTFVNGEGESG